MWLLAFALWGLTAALWLSLRAARAWRATLHSAQEVPIASLLASMSEVAQEIGHGSYQAYVALSGSPHAPTPLTAPASKTPCLYYEVQVERVFDEEVEHEDDKGNKRRHVVTRSEEVTRHHEATPFLLNDPTGSLRIQPAGATYEGLHASRVVFVPVEALDGDRRDPSDHHRLPWPWLPTPTRGPHPGRRRTVGYRCRERTLPADTPRLTVIGEASDLRGEPSLRKDLKPLVISTLPREDLEAKARRQAHWLDWGLKGAAAGAAALSLIAWWRG